MNPTQSTAPIRMSNEDFQSGAIYGGGRGKVLAARFQYHDYNGKHPKDSFTGFFITLRPSDGSNGGKDAELFWNVGPASEVIPDMENRGGTCLGLHGKTQISNNSNYAKYFHDKAKLTCGLPVGRLDGQTGVHILEGSEMGFSQVDQDDRDFADSIQPGQQPGQPKKKNKVLIPTFAKWVWEGGMGAVSQMPNPVVQTGQAQGTAPATHTNGAPASGISQDLANILKSIGTVDLSSNPAKSVLDYCVANNIVNPARMPIVKEATALFKDAANLEVLAAANGWTVSGGILMAG